MAIKINSNFQVGSPEPLDTRTVLTKAEMKAMDDAIMPDIYYALCLDDGGLYIYNKQNTIDVVTGRFKAFSGGGDAAIELTQTEYNLLVEQGKIMADITYYVKDSNSEASEFYTKEEVNRLIKEMNLAKTTAADAKPIYSAEAKTITYVQNGEIKSTDDLSQWFYYTIGDQMYQTIWIDGIEKTILSAGTEIDADQVQILTKGLTEKSLQAMYDSGELGGNVEIEDLISTDAGNGLTLGSDEKIKLTVSQTYSATGTDAVSGKAVASAISGKANSSALGTQVTYSLSGTTLRITTK